MTENSKKWQELTSRDRAIVPFCADAKQIVWRNRTGIEVAILEHDYYDNDYGYAIFNFDTNQWDPGSVTLSNSPFNDPIPEDLLAAITRDEQ